MLETNLPANIWDKALHHANWLQNRLPSFRIKFTIPETMGSQSTYSIKTSSQIRFVRICVHLSTVKNKKSKNLLPSSEVVHFLGTEGGQRLIRASVLSTNTSHRVRRAYLHLNKVFPSPSVSALLDGIARQWVIEEEGNIQAEQTESTIQSKFASLPSPSLS